MSILIIVVSPYVYDTSAVTWGLRQLQQNVDVYFPEEYPAHLSLSLQFDRQNKAGIKTFIDIGNQQIEASSYKSVWLRHKLRITEQSTLANASDALFAALEADHLIQSMLCLLSPSLWVNPPQFNEKAFLKPVQLATALEVGFRIPKTLMSNDPKQIIDFILMMGGTVLFKSFNAVAWEKNSDSWLQNMSTLINKNMINDSAKLCPAIYQEFIRKQADIRVIIMGKQIFSIQQDSLNTRYVDSRLSSFLEKPDIMPIELPDSIKLHCLQLMECLGLIFGCIDLILDTSGDYWFLEVNPNGQFLGYEEICPSLPLLDTFCELLASGNSEYLREQRPPRIRYKDFLITEGIKTSLAWRQRITKIPLKNIFWDTL